MNGGTDLLSLPWGAIVAFSVVLWGVLWLALQSKLGSKFVVREDLFMHDGKEKYCTRESVNGLGQRVDRDIADVNRKADRNAGLFVQLDDRMGALEGRVSLLEERHTQQWGRIADQMAATARTIEDVVKRLEVVSKEQSLQAQEHALLVERWKNLNRGQGT